MIEMTKDGRVAHLVINQPPVNVLDSAVLSELCTRLDEIAGDESISAVLLSGEGKCFSAGASVAEHRADQAREMIDGLLAACTALTDLPMPVIAMVHGPCLGGAMELVAFCDFVVADPGATFGQPEIKLSFFPPVAAVRLPRLCGLQNAAYSMLSGDNIPADRALTMGIAQKLLPQDEWPQMAKAFNRLSGSALRMTKRAILEGGAAPLKARLEAVKELFLGPLYELADVEEGISSFEERRKPEWKHN